jgi:3-hydroxyacyl-CoA dehydrogenase
MILMNAMQQNWDAIDEALVGMQGLLMRAKYSKKPVVVAPYGLTLGGGAEVAMQCTATVAAAELYMGLVEVGVGLIPGGGGCKEMMVRYLGDLPQDAGYDPNPLLQKAFEQIGMGKVATSAEEARAVGMLRPTDMMVINGEDLLSKAKRVALGLAAAGITPPAERTIKVPGRSGRAAIELFLRQMKQGGYASEHDILVGSKLANVLTGGDVPNNTVLTERDLLDLEREAFLSLCGEPKTLERIQYMLEKGKPLRN